MATGLARDCPVAWLDDAARTLTFLPQRYGRRSELTYGYESPTSEYAALLELTPAGFARVYPASGGWKATARRDRRVPTAGPAGLMLADRLGAT